MQEGYKINMPKIINVKQKVSPEMIIGFNPNHGSVKNRDKIADIFTKDFISRIRKEKEDSLTFDKVGYLIFATLYMNHTGMKPDIFGFRKLDVKEESDFTGGMGCCCEIHEDKDQHTIEYNGYRIFLDIDGVKIKSSKGTIAHEVRHMFDSMCSPKTICHRMNALILNPNELAKRQSTGDLLTDAYTRLSKKDILENISSYDDYTKTQILADARADIKKEMLAYKAGLIAELKSKTNSIFDKIKHFVNYCDFKISTGYEKRYRTVCKLERMFIQKERQKLSRDSV